MSGIKGKLTRKDIRGDGTIGILSANAYLRAELPNKLMVAWEIAAIRWANRLGGEYKPFPYQHRVVWYAEDCTEEQVASVMRWSGVDTPGILGPDEHFVSADQYPERCWIVRTVVGPESVIPLDWTYFVAPLPLVLEVGRMLGEGVARFAYAIRKNELDFIDLPL